MTQPIGGFDPNKFVHYGTFDDPVGQAAQNLCKRADTVTAGFLCDEPTVVSDACRSPNNAVDAFICDDKKMAAVQGTIVDGLREAAKALLSALVGRAK